MDKNYIKRRQNNIFSRYKLASRNRIILKNIKKFATLHENIKILDIGACDGSMLSYIKNKIPFADCYGIEPVQDFIGKCSDKRIKLFLGTAENIDFPENYFDVVFMSSVIEHIENPHKGLSEAMRVLKTGGLFVIITVVPFYEKLSVLLRIKKDDHFRNYNLSEINALISDTGFKILYSRKLLIPLFYQISVAQKEEIKQGRG